MSLFLVIASIAFAAWIGGMIYITTIGISDWFNHRRKS